MAGRVGFVVSCDTAVGTYSFSPRTPEARAWFEKQTGVKGIDNTNLESVEDLAARAEKAGFRVSWVGH